MSAPPNPPPAFDIAPVAIEDEMQRSYLDYAMSVIVSRALPDVRDGLKPVHRRILYAMQEAGYTSDKVYRKSARIVGDVMGKYHPHGDAAIYDAMVRMAQDFALRLPLIDGQGNYGSMDGDPPAAMRYTEARLAKSAEALIDDIDKDTVDFRANYDETTDEPSVLPARFPNLLVNGAGGIAVGMATNIPPHNLGEVIDACCAIVEDPEIGIDALIEIVPGPDFPTGAIIVGRSGILAAYHTGRGSVVMRSRCVVEEIRKDRDAIVVSEIPYQVNKSRLLMRIAEVVNDKTVEGVADLRDESDRSGVRVVIELKRDANAEVVLNQLYRHTPLQTSFGVNMLALDGGRPVLMHLKQILDAFVAFREEVIRRRTVYLLGRARDRAHVLAGLAIAVANIDAVIKLIREAKDPAEARASLMAAPWPAGEVRPLIELIAEPDRQVAEDGSYRLSERQARAILELRLQRLTGLERGKIATELEAVVGEIAEFLEILRSRPRRLALLVEELLEMKEKFATPRRTVIEDAEFEQDIEDLIQREEMVVTVSHGGYIKRVPLSTYRAQRRGGKGRAGMATRQEDFVSQLFVANTHTPMLFFSSNGVVYKKKVYRLPIGTPQARGKALVNLLPLGEGERITTVMPMPEDEDSWQDLTVMFATASGNVRRNSLSDFVRIQANGKIAMRLAEGEHLVGVTTCTEADDVLLATRRGKCIRFAVADVRVFRGRTATGVRGIRLAAEDEVISMSILRHVEAETEQRDAYLRLASARRRMVGDETAVASCAPEDVDERITPERAAELESQEEFILSIAEDGMGKRSSAYEYRTTGRGGKGIENMDLSRGDDRDPTVVAAFPVQESHQIILVTDGGQLIRCPVDDVRIAGRRTRGVTLFNVAEDERVVSVTRLEEDEDDDEEDNNGVDDGDDGDDGGEQGDGDA